MYNMQYYQQEAVRIIPDHDDDMVYFVLRSFDDNHYLVITETVGEDPEVQLMSRELVMEIFGIKKEWLDSMVY